jgi:uncharacterized protein with HEPN domain
MENRIKKLLYDISIAIEDIENFLGQERNFENYVNNKLLKASVERKIEIIGEAINRLLKLSPEIEIKNARRIVDTRNKIIHGYDEVEDTYIWAIIINYLPTLKSEIEKLSGSES